MQPGRARDAAEEADGGGREMQGQEVQGLEVQGLEVQG